MDPRISNLISSLAVPTAQAEAIANIFSDDLNLAAFLHGRSWDTSSLTNTACAVLKLILGETKVVTDSAHSSENWSVHSLLGLSNPLILTRCLKVPNMLELTHLHNLSREQERRLYRPQDD